MARLDGKVAIITGAAGGMGLTMAQVFAKEGAKVVAADIQQELLQEGVEGIKADGGDAIAVKVDVSSPEEWKNVVDEAVEKYGKVDVLVNNAAIQIGKNVKEATLDEWNKVLTINATSVFLGMQTVIPEMQKNGRGSIINMSSIGGIVGGAPDGHDVAYSASKGAVRSMTKHAAKILAEDKIRVNSVHPGVINTPMVEKSFEEYPELKETVKANFPLPPHTGEPEDLAYMVVFLASDESKFATGSEFVIDGGATSTR